MEGQTTIYDFFLNQKKYDPVEAYAKRGSGFEGGKSEYLIFSTKIKTQMKEPNSYKKNMELGDSAYLT